MALIQNFNVNPYYDDFSEDKKFLRLLFKPGYAVQARELTQLQTILQNQVSRFGKHIFKDGSQVRGGEITFNSSVTYHKIQATTSGGQTVDVNNFLNKSIGNAHAIAADGSLGKVIAVVEATSTDPAFIIVSYKTGMILQDSETFFTVDNDLYEARLQSSNSTGKAFIASIGEGIFFIDGFFVKVDAQTIVLEKDETLPTYRVGLEYTESIVEESTDTSLLDPALNASNYQAPGANRYKVTLTLSKRTLNSTDDSKFFELKRVENGVVTLETPSPDYSDILKVMAGRTYDESGNYTVNPFKIYLKDHQPEIGAAANSQQFTAVLGAGKAYIRGYEVSRTSDNNLTLDRARDIANVTNYDIACNYGNYLTVANTTGLFDVSTMGIIDMHCVDASNIATTNTTTYGSTKIGTARIRELEYVSAANTQLANTYKHNLYIYDTQFIPISNNAMSGGTTNTIVLGTSGISSPVANAYLNAFIRISSGYGADNTKHKIVNYNQTTRTVTIEDSFSTAPIANSIYSIDFNIKDIDSFASANAAAKIISSANVSIENKEGGVLSGNTFLSDTNFKSLVFRVPQSFVSFNMTNQDYRARYSFKNQTISSGQFSISVSALGNGANLVGSGALSDSQKLEHFYVTANTMGAVTDFTNGQIIPLVTGTGRSVTISSGTDAAINLNNANSGYTVDAVVSVDYNSASPKTKTLVTANTIEVGAVATTIGSANINLSFGQVAISTPNKTPGQSDSLYISDIYKLDDKFEEEYGSFTVVSGSTTKKASFKVIDSGSSSSNVVTADITNTAKDITSKYILNDGQDDGFYNHGSITLRPGISPPTGQILVLVNYFTHSTGLFLSGDSYNVASLGATTDIRYAKIPNFTSPTTGETYKLRDCIDFRPIRTNASNTSPNYTLTGVSIPKAGESLESNYSYYLPRIDRIIIRDDRKFEVLKGISSISPQTPSEPENCLSLYTVRVNPYTFFPSDTQIRYIENKRYTMKDIGKLDKRIQNLEYYTSLNTLEKSAQDLTVLDSSGLERFKNGILVDSFRGHQVGDVKSLDYRCSMDFTKGELRPSFEPSNFSFTTDTGITTANVSAGTIITAPYTIANLITQNVSSTFVPVNPFTLSHYVGTLDFYPSGDFWIDTETRPDVLINLEGENDAWEKIGQALEDARSIFGYQWNDWQEFISSASSETKTESKSRTEGYLDYEDTYNNTYKTTLYSQERTGTRTILVPERIVASIGKRQVDLSVIPYIRGQYIISTAKGLRPNEYHYAYLDDTNITHFLEFPTICWLFDTSGSFFTSYGNYETVTSSSGGSATLVKTAGRSWSLEQPHIYLANVTGTFANNDTVTGLTSGATGKIDIAFWNNGNVNTATASTITLHSGSPYTNTYSNIVSTYANVTWANTGTKVLEDDITINQFYKIRIISGKGLGQERTITSYNGTTKLANVTPNWTVVPDSTSRWSVGKPQTDDHGDMPGRLYIPNYSTNDYDDGIKFRTGQKFIRIGNDANNDLALITSFAEESFYAQGVLNTIEDVSVSVRNPSIQVKDVYSKEENYRATTTLTDSNITGTKLVADRTPPPPSGGSGCKIICTKLHELGYLPEEIYEADQKFGEILRQKDPNAYYGYIKWASIVVDWMSGKGPQCMFWIRDQEKRAETQRKLATSWAIKIATPWAEHMAYKMGVGKQDNPTGRKLMKVGLFISKVVGKLTNKNMNSTPNENRLVVGYLLWIIFGGLRLITLMNRK
jgi:hypothetical protein